MDYEKVFKELGVEIRRLPDNYSPDAFALSLFQNATCGENIIYYVSTSTDSMNSHPCLGSKANQ